ncbi:hypothetical protein F4604DRAFT_1679689 [Suillus subluteus]|nr:hypothetical protein F4604DRAFT_1679689 [Suillus subluteus]
MHFSFLLVVTTALAACMSATACSAQYETCVTAGDCCTGLGCYMTEPVHEYIWTFVVDLVVVIVPGVWTIFPASWAMGAPLNRFEHAISTNSKRPEERFQCPDLCCVIQSLSVHCDCSSPTANWRVIRTFPMSIQHRFLDFTTTNIIIDAVDARVTRLLTPQGAKGLNVESWMRQTTDTVHAAKAITTTMKGKCTFVRSDTKFAKGTLNF